MGAVKQEVRELDRLVVQVCSALRMLCRMLTYADGWCGTGVQRATYAVMYADVC